MLIHTSAGAAICRAQILAALLNVTRYVVPAGDRYRMSGKPDARGRFCYRVDPAGEGR